MRASEAEALMSASRRSSVPAPAANAGPRGRERPYAAQVATQLPGTHGIVNRGYREKSRTRKTGKTLTAGAGSDGVRRGDATASSLTSLNSNCFQNSGERYWSLTVLPSGKLRHQRFLRVRTVAELGNGEVKAKNRTIACCESTDGCKQCVNIRDFEGVTVEIRCNTAGKSVHLQREWCGRRRTHFARRRVPQVLALLALRRATPGRECGWAEASRFPAPAQQAHRWQRDHAAQDRR